MKVSVIIPVHDRVHLLGRGLESVLSQTYRNLELLIIDDHSQDGLDKFVRTYQERDDRVRYAKTKDYGVSAARNLGMDLADGDYFIFLDSDDYWEENLLEKLLCVQVQETTGGNGLDLVIGGFDLETDLGERIKTSDLSGNIQRFTGREVLSNVTKKGYGPFACWGRLFSSRLVKNIRFPLGVAMSEDGIFMTHVYGENPQIAYVPEVLFHVVMHSQNIQWGGFRPKLEYDEIHQYELVVAYVDTIMENDMEARRINRLVWFDGKVQILRRMARKSTNMTPEEKSIYKSQAMESIKKDFDFVRKAGSRRQKLRVFLLKVCPEMYLLLYQLAESLGPLLLSSNRYKRESKKSREKK